MINTYRIVAIRAVMPSKFKNADQKRHVQQIQKALYSREDWLYFYNDVIINNDCIECRAKNDNEIRLYDLPDIHIDICALVGKNGTGKSSLVDLLIRTINNVSAALIGEYYRFPAAEHLHYIEDVYSDLCIEHDNQYDIIEMRGRDVVINHYKRNFEQERWYFSEFKPGEIYTYEDYTNILTSSASPNVPIEGCVNRTSNDNYVKFFRDFCYTLVCDYSMYDFNYRNYTAEQTPHKRLEAIYASGRKNGYEIAYESKHYPKDAIWLKGLFYKNDDYQTPIVIHPMRTNGVIDINREHFLSKERLLSLFFYKDKQNNYPLRKINGELEVIKVRLTRSDADYGDKNYVFPKLGIEQGTNLYKNYDEVARIIGTYWLSAIHQKNRKLNIDEQAVYNYIIYKTIKIARTYKFYQDFGAILNVSEINEDYVNECLDTMKEDKTHRTHKFRRALNYLQTDIYVSNNDNKEYGINQLCARIEAIASNDIQAYLPPPIFDVDFILSNNTCDTIEFSHLSAGEKQIAYIIGGFLYHIINVESAWKMSYDIDDFENARYRYLNVIFDEVEQYFHPDLQRRFISLLLTSLASVHFHGIKAMNIIIVTHSPFILSDIPKDNVLVLSGRSQQSPLAETFGGNIGEILGYPFFMDYSIGEFAKQQLEQIIQLHDTVLSGNFVRENVSVLLPKYEYLIRLIGDSFIKEMLNDMLKEIKQICS